MYHKGIPFAEHNFSPFQDIFFVTVLFESQSKTLFRVLFSSLYPQICIFYFGISKYLNFTRELRRRFDRKYTLDLPKHCVVKEQCHRMRISSAYRLYVFKFMIQDGGHLRVSALQETQKFRHIDVNTRLMKLSKYWNRQHKS